MPPKRTSKKRPARRSLPVVPDAQRAQVGCLTCALCCSYIAVEIDGPTSVKSATEILWHLYHHNVSVYRDNDDDWVVQFETRCRHLQDDNKCGIYETRPHICREYSELTCEVNSEDQGRTFYSPAEFLDYLKERNKRTYEAVQKRYMPAPEALAALPQTKKQAASSFQARFRAIRGA